MRKCPSGALGLGLDGVRDPALTDPKRPMRVEVSKDGPYRVTGGVALFDEAGEPAALNGGASPEHYSLCRCGASLNKPFCSGMHWSVEFADPATDPAAATNPVRVGRRLSRAPGHDDDLLQQYVPQDPLIGPLFANMSPDHPERVAAWLTKCSAGRSSIRTLRRLLPQ